MYRQTCVICGSITHDGDYKWNANMKILKPKVFNDGVLPLVWWEWRFGEMELPTNSDETANLDWTKMTGADERRDVLDIYTRYHVKCTPIRPGYKFSADINMPFIATGMPSLMPQKMQQGGQWGQSTRNIYCQHTIEHTSGVSLINLGTLDIQWSLPNSLQ